MGRLTIALVASLVLLTACGENGTAPSSGTIGTDPGSGLPDACTILRQADLSTTFAGAAPVLTELPAVSNEDVAVSQCTASSETSKASLALLVREQLTSTYRMPSAEQAEEMVATTAPGGPLEGMKLEQVTGVGEAALWSPDAGQLNVFFRGGQTYFIVTVSNAADNQAAARSLAVQVAAKYR